MPTTNTKTIKPSGGDYTSLSAWEAGRQADLVTGDIIEVAECYAMNDTTPFTIAGWTTDATRYIEIRTAAGEGHAGTWSTSKYYLSGTNATLIDVQEEFVRILGLQGQLTYTGSGELACVAVGLLSGTSDVRIGKCLFKGIVSGDYGTAYGVFANDTADGNSVVNVFDSVAYDFRDTTW